MQRGQFQSNLDSELRVWLIDQKPMNLSEAARLADQYVAVQKANRPVSTVRKLGTSCLIVLSDGQDKSITMP